MAWARVTDTFNVHPVWMAAAALAADRGDGRLVDELKGVTIALYTQSAVAWSDYKVSFGMAVMVIGLPRVDQVLADLEFIGVLTRVGDAEVERSWSLLEDNEFVHIFKLTDKLRKAKRARDRNRGSLQVPVLLRDGSQCRYCEIEVNWNDHKNDDGGTFDHRDIRSDTTPDNYVVCCRACNEIRECAEVADDELPLLSPPENPIYDDALIEKLGKWKRITKKVCADLGIPNPLTGEVEARRPRKSARRDASGAATAFVVSTSVSSPEPATSQVACDPRFPGEVSASGRAANARPSGDADAHVSSMGETSDSFVPSTVAKEPADCQSVCDPQGLSADDVTSDGPANESHISAPSRKRRRRRRR